MSALFRASVVLFAIGGCSETGITPVGDRPDDIVDDGDGPGFGPPGFGGPGFGDDDDDDDNSPGDDDDDDGPGDDHDPPEFLDDPCDPGDLATTTESMLIVGSWDPLEASTTLVAPAAGEYDVYNTHIVESGPSQWNETAYVRITNAGNPDGRPVFGNCGPEWIVADADNFGPPPGVQTYIGTFWLEGGNNTLTVHHYCPENRAAICEGFEFMDDPNSTCASNNFNSVHFNGEGVCLIPVE